MDQTQERGHTFRVQMGCGDEEFIDADYMAVSGHGIVQLLNEGSSQPVAMIFAHPGMSVVRLDALLNHEELNRS